MADRQGMRSSRPTWPRVLGRAFAILCVTLPLATAALGDPPEIVAPAPAATVAACTPAPVACDLPPPHCGPDDVAEASPCSLGNCPQRCWTGRCIPCAHECAKDEDCALIGRHGCCGDAGDCENGCFWSAPRATLEADTCVFEAVCPVPAAPLEACPQSCQPGDLCGACPHCRPELARCDAGRCESAWPSCEPTCMCD